MNACSITNGAFWGSAEVEVFYTEQTRKGKLINASVRLFHRERHGECLVRR
jgi:hypothetical protein